MKPLERRKWFEFSGITLSAVLMLGLWKSVELPLNLSSGAIFLFATLGLWQGLHKISALLLIKLIPSLGTLK